MASARARGPLLVVEDPFVRAFIHACLARHGFEVLEADPCEGLKVLQSGETTVRLLITNQPQVFSAAGCYPALLYLAAFPDERLAQPFPHWRTLRKPFQPNQLVKTVQELLEEA